jgi:GNAT superfamily N-acetyltransferase
MPITISNKHEDMDLDMIHHYLSEVGYWSPGISRDRVERAMKGSLPFGLFLDGQQVAYARVVSDYVSFAYLGDVFVLPEYQGKGFGKQLLTAIHAHPQLQGMRGWVLKTRDAHGLYRQFGWEVDPTPEWTMAFRPSKQS